MADDTTRIINLTEATEVSDGMYLVTDASTGTRKLSLQKVLDKVLDKVGGNVADDYDATATYSVGDLCIYNNLLYECTTAITTAEAWNSAHWALTNVGDEISDIKEDLSDFEDALESEDGITKTLGLNSGLEAGFVNTNGAVQSTGSHSHITISAMDVESVTYTNMESMGSLPAVMGKFNGVYKVVADKNTALPVKIKDVDANVAEGDLLYFNFYGQVYNNPVSTGNYVESYTVILYNRSERFGILTEAEVSEIARTEAENVVNNVPVVVPLSSLDVYETNKFMKSDGTVSNANHHKIVSLSAKDIASISYTSATASAVPIIIEKLGATVHGLGGADDTSEHTYVPFSNDSTIYINFFDYDTAQDYVTQITVAYDDIIQSKADEIINIAEARLLFNLVRKPFTFSGKHGVFCGDSITKGFTSTSTTTENGYPKLFSNAVGMTFENKGVGGATMGVVTGYSSILTQVQAVNTATADFVFIAGGVNDWQTGQTLADFKTAVNNICDYINTNYPNDLPVIWITPINQGGWELTHIISPKGTLSDFRRIITEAVVMKDTYSRFSIVQGEWFNFPTKDGNLSFINAMFGDRLHPTELGYKVLYTTGLLTALC